MELLGISIAQKVNRSVNLTPQEDQMKKFLLLLTLSFISVSALANEGETYPADCDHDRPGHHPDYPNYPGHPEYPGDRDHDRPGHHPGYPNYPGRPTYPHYPGYRSQIVCYATDSYGRTYDAVGYIDDPVQRWALDECYQTSYYCYEGGCHRIND